MEQERQIRNWCELEVRADQHPVQLNNFLLLFSVVIFTSSSSSSLDSSLKYLTSCLVTRPLRRLAAILGGGGWALWKQDRIPASAEHTGQRSCDPGGFTSDPTFEISVADPLDVYPGSEFFHPGSRVKKRSGFRIRIHIKEFKHIEPKKWFLSSRKYVLGCWSRIRILIFCNHIGSRN